MSAFPDTGLWPILTVGSDWPTTELQGPERPSTASAVASLKSWWDTNLRDAPAPSGAPDGWPGIAPVVGTSSLDLVPSATPLGLLSKSTTGLLLIPARPADALAAIGWLEATDYHSAGELTPVLRSWHDRFGCSADSGLS